MRVIKGDTRTLDNGSNPGAVAPHRGVRGTNLLRLEFRVLRFGVLRFRES